MAQARAEQGTFGTPPWHITDYDRRINEWNEDVTDNNGHAQIEIYEGGQEHDST